MHHDVDGASCFADCGVVERVNLHDLGVGRGAGRAARADQADHGPAGIAECFAGLVAEPAGGAEHQDTCTHDHPWASRKRISWLPARCRAIVRAAEFISNAGDLISHGGYVGDDN